MNKRIAILIASTFCAMSIAQGREPLLPALQPGDILLCEGFPRQKVTGTGVTMYQLARLGYSKVREFQQDKGLKIDGIIGPQTQGKVEEEYNRSFTVLARAQTDAPLSLAGRLVTNAVQVSLIITVANDTKAPVRIVGALASGPNDDLLLADPALSVQASFCRHNPETGVVACGSENHEIGKYALSEPIEPGGSLRFSAHVSRLAKNESGSASVQLQYLTWDGTSFRDHFRRKRPR